MHFDDSGIRAAQQQAAMQQYQGLQQRGFYEQTKKDPTVDSAAAAVKALEKRAQELRNKLAGVEGWKAELAQVERMLAAAK